MKQTAVEWLLEQLRVNGRRIFNIIEQAKEMEKEQIKDAFVECWKSNVPDGVECKLDAEQYYNEKFKSGSLCKPLNQNKMKIIHLINETYQVVSNDETIVYFQGSKEECERYRMNNFFNL